MQGKILILSDPAGPPGARDLGGGEWALLGKPWLRAEVAVNTDPESSQPREQPHVC